MTSSIWELADPAGQFWQMASTLSKVLIKVSNLKWSKHNPFLGYFNLLSHGAQEMKKRGPGMATWKRRWKCVRTMMCSDNCMTSVNFSHLYPSQIYEFVLPEGVLNGSLVYLHSHWVHYNLWKEKRKWKTLKTSFSQTTLLKMYLFQ